MNMIEINNGVFLLNTKDTSYLFRKDMYGHLEHLYYGSSCKISDAEAFSYKKRIGHGTTVAYDENKDFFTMDSLPQEFPTYGCGDFNEAAIEIDCHPSFTCDFLFDSYEILHEDCKIDNLPSSYGSDEVLLLHLKDEVNHLSLDLYYTIYYEENVITRRSVLFNHSDKEYTLHKFMSFGMDLCEKDLVLMNLHGAWDSEAHIEEKEILRGTYISSSRVGFSSAKNNPAFLIKKKDTDEEHGKAWGFNLVYSGNHYSSVSYNEYGFCRILSGISPERFHLPLKAGASFSSPEAVLTYSDEGLNKLSQNFHSFINEHIVRSDWKKKERPILINSWEGFGFDFHKEDLINKLAVNARDLGMELFVLDDGWFGRRENDTKGLGDYDCNLEKIPGGLSSLSKEVHDLGLLFGLWVEPEAINIDSALYEAHPEYALHEEDRPYFLGRHELLMDLTNREVRDYIVDQVSALIDENQIDYIKWDMNRMMNAVSGTCNHEYIKGLYEVLERIFTPRPHVLFESCASGGNRFDPGMLCYSPQIWASDDTDPIERLEIQKGLSYFYPVSVMGAHVSASPHSQTLRHTPLETRFSVAAYGCLGYELDLSELSEAEKEEIRNQICFYKEHRHDFQFGTFYRITKEEDLSFEVKGENTIVTKFRKQKNAVPFYDRLHACGLEKEETYQILSRTYFFEADRYGKHIPSKDPEKNESNQQEYEASGAALKEGILLEPLCLGTGYNEKIRIPLDYGSDMYVITKK